MSSMRMWGFDLPQQEISVWLISLLLLNTRKLAFSNQLKRSTKIASWWPLALRRWWVLIPRMLLWASLWISSRDQWSPCAISRIGTEWCKPTLQTKLSSFPWLARLQRILSYDIPQSSSRYIRQTTLSCLAPNIWNQFYMQVDGFTCRTACNFCA